MDYKEKLIALLNDKDLSQEQKEKLEQIFPLEQIYSELKESKDEKIRKELIEHIKANCESGFILFQKFSPDDVLVWLEKQGENTNNWRPSKEQYEALDYAYNSCSDTERGNYYEGVLETLIEDLHMLEKQGEQKSAIKVEHLIPQKGMYYTCIKDYYSSDNTHLCVKGNIYKSFFNGYINDELHLGLSWNNSCTEKYFEPTKDEDWIVCEHSNVIGKPMQYKELKKKVNQKFIENLKAKGLSPKLRLWNLQDAKPGDVLVDSLDNVCIYQEPSTKLMYHSYCYGNHKHFINMGGSHDIVGSYPATKEQRDLLFLKMKEAGYEWDAEKKELKKIEQKSTKNEELTEFDKAVGVSIGTWNPKTPEQIKSVKAVSKKLLELAKKQINDEQKPAWNEEDEKQLNDIIELLPDLTNRHSWLKSLKGRYTWKPSEEQMKVLEELTEDNNQRYFYTILESLYNDLKKLMEK